MKRALIYVCVSVAAACAVCCGPRKGGGDTVANDGGTTECKEQGRVFLPALAPSMLPPDEKTTYLNEHYWDRFDFADTLFIAEADTAHMLTAFAVYAGRYVPDSLASESMSRLMTKASASKRMFDYFMMLAETVLHDPNSPMRNDELYIPVLEAALRSDLLDEYEKMPYEYDLDMALRNRVGREAADFEYTLASGRSGRMHDITADYLLIFVSNPGCPMCRDVREQIAASPMLNELSERGTLKVLVIYPDDDLVAWREHLSDYPSAWINAYDRGMTISKERLYDLKAIPSLYLLDADKRVMAKDCTDVEYIERLIAASEES